MVKPKILVVDDSITVREIVRRVLEEEGFEVITSGDGRDALHRVEAEHPDLVLLDIVLPEFDGYEICRRIKSVESFKNLPIILITGRSQLVDEQELKNIGAADYVLKPIDPMMIVGKINHLLKQTQESGGRR
jgi:DNA-binding response OmpR family regulator